MDRRALLAVLLGAIAAGPLESPAQPRQKTPVIGYLTPIVPQNNTDARLESFRHGMRELGYVEGKDYLLEVRWGQGKLERMPVLAEELVNLKVDILIGASTPAYLAAKDATRTIPIVAPTMSDPVADGLVASLARPGGNLTGLSLMAPELGAKRLQLLGQILPKASRAIGIVWNPAYTGMGTRFTEAKLAGSSVGMSMLSIEVRDARGADAVLDALSRDRPDGLLLLLDPLTLSLRSRIISFARVQKIPVIYETREFAEAGGLMSYGPNILAQFRRAAYYVDRILKGAKPGDLPIEQPAKLELLVNLTAARALGVVIPREILVSTDEVIE